MGELIMNINGEVITIIATYGVNDEAKLDEKEELFERPGNKNK